MITDENNFEIVGYNIDVYYNGKYFGYMKTSEPDREKMGYYGRKKTILSEDFIFKKKKLKAGTEVITECIPICGKLKGTFKEKINKLEQSRTIYNYK